MNTEITHLSPKFIAYLRQQLNAPLLDYKTGLTQLQGGFETHIYRFQLQGAPPEFSAPLILRLYPAYYGTGNAIWESTIQNVLQAEGYPVAKAHLVGTDLSILGGAFFIMDFLPGIPLIAAPKEAIPTLLGQAHAALHRIDPKSLLQRLGEHGIDESMCHLDRRFAKVKSRVHNFPWLGDAVGWLLENRPPEPPQLAVCHGDFHPLNILVQDEVITGVLDWPGFLLADPALDLAATMVLMTISAKHIGPAVGLDISPADARELGQRYLDAYQNEASAELSHLAYYQVWRCVNALFEGAEGQAVWQHPAIVEDLHASIHEFTGIRIEMPA